MIHKGRGCARGERPRGVNGNIDKRHDNWEHNNVIAFIK